MDIRKVPFLFIGAAILILLGLAIFKAEHAEAPADTKPSVAAGVRPGSNDFTYDNASGDTILVDSPKPGAKVGKQFSVTGRARGPWYFEASFPVVILDRDGKILTQKPATAEGEWMTNEFVPFTVDVSIPESYEGAATVVLKKDNPSGLSKNEASVSLPIEVAY